MALSPHPPPNVVLPFSRVLPMNHEGQGQGQGRLSQARGFLGKLVVMALFEKVPHVILDVAVGDWRRRTDVAARAGACQGRRV